MRFLPPDDEVILYETTFENNLLGRNSLSKQISEMLEKIEDPLVVALDGRWGTGKSYFLKRWVAAHTVQNKGKGQTLYFDAFAHDYLSDPLVALVGALSERFERNSKSKITKLKKTASKFLKPATRLTLSIATVGATTVLSDVGDVIAKAIEDESKKALEDLWKREQGRHEAMKEFHNAIKALTEGSDESERKPLIIVIDELDRCRPDYALEVLEVIKHFFAVPRVHFILGVNLLALENSVKARYGIEMDASSYLRKFLSVTVNLPKNIGDQQKTSSILAYVDYLGKSMEISPYLLGEIRQQIRILSRENEISIRDVGKIMSRANLLPEDAKGENLYQGWRMVAVTLLITMEIRPDYVQKFLSKTISERELSSYFGATKRYLAEFLENGEWNPDRDRELRYRYSVWRWLVNDGVSEVNEDTRSIVSLFDRFGSADSAKDVPQIVYERWLTVFKLP